jgi:hypothetical protein
MSRRAQHGLGDSHPEKTFELLAAAQFFDSEVERIDLMWIDQDASDFGAAEHGGRSRAGKAAADNRNVGVPRGEIPGSKACFCAGNGK